MLLSGAQARVMGCLIEKQLSTPQQYPLTLNALTLACNQTSNRDPIVSYPEHLVTSTLDELKSEHLVRFVLPSHGRSVVRYRQVLDEVFGVDAPRLALLAELLLRGPQTVGQLRTRCERMVAFDDLDTIERELSTLSQHETPLVALLPRRPGQKEERWRCLLVEDSWSDEGPSRASDPRLEASASGRAAPASEPGGGPALQPLRDEIALLHAELADLRAELGALRASLGG